MEPIGSAPAAPHESAMAAGGAHGGEDIFDPTKHRPTARNLVWTGAITLLVFGALLVTGIVPRVFHRSAMAADERRAASELPRVRVARAERASAEAALVLPGSVQPLQESSMFARVNGYVRTWLVDIGAPVKVGQVLAELDLPDIDEELRQAKASAAQTQAGIEQARTQLVLARTTNARYSALGPSGIVSQQEVDQYRAGSDAQQANLAAAEAAYRSAQANVRRYQDLKSFGTIVAPFDGIVTMRSAEIGQLVVSGTGQGQPLFKVAQVDVVRVFVSVPQLYAAGIRVGTHAPTSVREAPGRVFTGEVARTSNELDMATRSLLTEVDIPNPDRVLVAGMYAHVSFDVKRQDKPLFVPSTALVIDALGTRVATVQGGVVHWKKVEIDSDFGDRIAIASGLRDGEMVAVIPNERLLEGSRALAEEATPEGAPRPAASPEVPNQEARAP